MNIRLIAAFVGLLALIAAIAFAAHKGYERGAADKQAEWTAANLEAAEQERARNEAIGGVLVAEDKRHQAAEAQARRATQQWQEARREARGRALAVCGPTTTVDEAAVADVARGSDLGGRGLRVDAPRLTAAGVRLYDAAWTGLDGKPVFPIADRDLGAGDAGASIDALLEVHAGNAESCSRDRRSLQTLMDRIREAERAWTR